MVSKRAEGQKPWMSADDYGRSLKGFTLNLLVRNVPRSVDFCREVLEAQVIYADADFAVMRRDCRGSAVEWMLHADHTYGDHPLLSLTGDGAIRGAGAEFRLHGVDPDRAAAAATRRGDTSAVATGEQASPARARPSSPIPMVISGCRTFLCRLKSG